jgi:hypothetical protein
MSHERPERSNSKRDLDGLTDSNWSLRHPKRIQASPLPLPRPKKKKPGQDGQDSSKRG